VGDHHDLDVFLNNESSNFSKKMKEILESVNKKAKAAFLLGVCQHSLAKIPYT
jgi:hypothetical protein